MEISFISEINSFAQYNLLENINKPPPFFNGLMVSSGHVLKSQLPTQ